MNNIFNILQSISNPQQYAYNELSKINNPLIKNALNGNAEMVVRNICRERQIDADALYNQVVSQFKR